MGHFLRCGLKARPTEFAAIFSDSCSNAAQFLCNPDWLAERLRFEPSLPFVSGAKSRCLRNMQQILQHTRLIRRIASELESGKTVPFLIPPNGERLAIVDPRSQVLRPFLRPNWFAHDCVPAAQSKSVKYLRRKCSSKGEWLAFFGNSCPCF